VEVEVYLEIDVYREGTYERYNEASGRDLYPELFQSTEAEMDHREGDTYFTLRSVLRCMTARRSIAWKDE
jgi:hypothetical protein